MNNPRNTDTRRQDYQFGDPLRRREQSVDSMWGWLVGLAVVVLIAFIVIVGWSSSGPTTASNRPPQTAPAATTTGRRLTRNRNFRDRRHSAGANRFYGAHRNLSDGGTP